MALLLGGCTRPARRADLDALYPVDRARAVVRLADQGDIKSVQRLVELLDDEDAAVRMYAILALERLCGENLGYEYHAPEADRRVAIERWREALREGRVHVRAKDAIGAARSPAKKAIAHGGAT